MLIAARALGHVRLIPWGVRDRIIRRIAPPGRHNMPFEAHINGATYAGNLNNYIDWVVYFFGQYERSLLRVIARLMKRTVGPHCFWDVGANTGHHSLAVAAMGAQVEAFEPWPAMIERLQANIALNPKLSIRLHEFGLGDRNETLPYSEPTNENLSAGSFLGPAPSIRLELKRGDDLPDIPPPTIIKMDIEGFEPRALAGMIALLQRHQPIAIVEFSERTAQELPGRSLPSCLPAGYSFHKIAGAERPHLMRFTDAPDGSNILCLPARYGDLVL